MALPCGEIPTRLEGLISMTTDGEIIEYVRDINVLLELGTYQGMSDAEIQSIIDYKVSVAEQDATANAHMDEAAENGRALIAAHTQAVQESTNMLKSLLSMSVPFASVTGEEVD